MKKILLEFGLTENQVTLYLALLKQGESSASKLSKSTGINRSTTYQELEILAQRGLVSHIIKEYKRYYKAAPPEKLTEILDTTKEKVQAIIPDLLELQKAAPLLPLSIEVFQGKEGVRTFYQLILKSKSKEVIAFGVTGLSFEILKYSFPKVLEKYLKMGKIRALANFDARKRLTETPSDIVQVKYMPKETYSRVTTVISGVYVGILSLIRDNIYVVVIKDKNLAEGYKNYFEFMWKAAKS